MKLRADNVQIDKNHMVRGPSRPKTRWSRWRRFATNLTIGTSLLIPTSLLSSCVKAQQMQPLMIQAPESDETRTICSIQSLEGFGDFWSVNVLGGEGMRVTENSISDPESMIRKIWRLEEAVSRGSESLQRDAIDCVLDIAVAENSVLFRDRLLEITNSFLVDPWQDAILQPNLFVQPDEVRSYVLDSYVRLVTTETAPPRLREVIIERLEADLRVCVPALSRIAADQTTPLWRRESIVGKIEAAMNDTAVSYRSDLVRPYSDIAMSVFTPLPLKERIIERVWMGLNDSNHSFSENSLIALFFLADIVGTISPFLGEEIERRIRVR